MIGIYKITNKLNNKCYIGQSNQLERRKQYHFNFYDKTSYIDQVINSEGKDNFIWEVIEYCEEKELNDKEVYWINFFNSVYPNGYNMYAGNNHTGFYDISQLSTNDIKFIRECYRDQTYKSAAEIQRKFFPTIDRHLIAQIYNGQIALDIMPEVYNKNYYNNLDKDLDLKQCGEQNVAAILTEEDVIEIRFLYTIKQRKEIFEIFSQYNERLITSVISGQNWKFLPIYKKRDKRWLYPKEWTDQEIDIFKEKLNGCRKKYKI